MGIKFGEREGFLKGSYAEVTKHMAANPRRISRIEVDLYLPASASAKDRKILENIAHTCPVWYSLHENIAKDIRFFWTL
jgi:hypothetical protein